MNGDSVWSKIRAEIASVQLPEEKERDHASPTPPVVAEPQARTQHRPAIPTNERARVAALSRYAILDTPEEPAFDDLVKLAALVCHTPLAWIGFVDSSREWFKARVGFALRTTPRDTSLCAHAILKSSSPLIIPDASRESRFAESPLVAGPPGIRYYVGTPLVTPDGYALGALCVADVVERSLEPAQLQALRMLARQVGSQLELRRSARDLRRARDTADAASRAKTEFLANISHEVRTPMNGILGMAELLQSTELSPEQLEYVQTLQGSGEALLMVLEGVLDFTNMEAEPVDVVDVEVDVRALVAEVVTSFKASAAGKPIEFLQVIDEAMPKSLRTDPELVKQVLGHLLSNAVKYTERGRIITASTFQDYGPTLTLTFAVADTGIGITPEVRQGLFRPFVQAESSSSRRYGGAGLGLAIARRVVEGMGGEISLDDDVEEGATFTFTIPVTR